MLNELKFVRAGVATKDFVPELTHFRICDGRVTGFNGELAISSPIAVDLDIAPNAAQFMGAINACDEKIILEMKDKRLKVRSGRFRTFINCIDVSQVPALVPVGNKITFPFSLVDCFKKLLPFVSDDASYRWANGILFRGQSAFATNNISFIEHWLGVDLPEVNIPSFAIKEIIRHGEEPSHMLIDQHRVSFHYEDGKWISAAVCVLEWPDVSKPFENQGNPSPPPEGFFDGIKKLIRFGDDLKRCYLRPGILSTSPEFEVEGAQVECEGILEEGCYNLRSLAALEKIAVAIDLGAYPKPALFIGDNIRGALVAYRR